LTCARRQPILDSQQTTAVRQSRHATAEAQPHPSSPSPRPICPAQLDRERRGIDASQKGVKTAHPVCTMSRPAHNGASREITGRAGAVAARAQFGPMRPAAGPLTYSCRLADAQPSFARAREKFLNYLSRVYRASFLGYGRPMITRLPDRRLSARTDSLTRRSVPFIIQTFRPIRRPRGDSRGRGRIM